MSWVREYKLNWAERLAMKIIKSGKIPSHVAFIMDGNRRYANKNNLKSPLEGHKNGFDKLTQTLHWCIEIGIKEVTVYAFSVENFKRNKAEVDTLMAFAEEKFNQIMQEKHQLEKRGICIRMFGNLKMLPPGLQKGAAAAVLQTRNNNKLFLNIAFAYTSRDEIAESIKVIVDGVQNNELDPCDISEALIGRCMHSGNSTDPDLLLRTSGETRLSDFMLWQASATVIYFAESLWPDLSFWHILAGIFHYQRNNQTMTKVKESLQQFSVMSVDGLNNQQLARLNDMREHHNQLKMNANTKLNNRGTQFLENFNRRCYDELVKLQNL